MRRQAAAVAPGLACVGEGELVETLLRNELRRGVEDGAFGLLPPLGLSPSFSSLGFDDALTGN